MLAIGIGRARRTQFNWVITGVAAIVNVTLNLTLIPLYGMMGAAVATVAAYTVMFLGMAWWSQRVFHVPYQWRRVAIAAAAGVGLAVVGKLVGGGLAARDRAHRRSTRSCSCRSASTFPAERKRIRSLVARA